MSATQRLLRFGVFELNLDTGELRKSGTIIKLPPQSFRLLVLLVSRAGQVVSREEIQNQLWGKETYVDFEHGVNKCVKQIRAALNDNADHPLYVETIPRFGYRFLAPVRSKTVLAPTPHVTESSSGIESGTSGRVLVRTDASSAMVPASPSAPAATATVAQPPEIALFTKAGFRFPRRWKLLTGLLVVSAAMVVGGVHWQSHRQRRLTKKYSIMLADFRKFAGDEIVNNDSLKQALSAALRQSPFLDVLPQEDVLSLLKQMSLPADTQLSPNVAREICGFADSDAYISGKIFRQGRGYVVLLSAVDCRSGQVVAATQSTPLAKEKMLDALGEAASELRGELGESLREAASVKAVVPQGWYMSGTKPAQYEAGTDAQSVYNDHPSAYLKSKRPVKDGFGTLMQGFPADKYLGKRVRLSGFVRSEGVQNVTLLWMRVDKGYQAVSFDNMGDRSIKGTTGWQNYAVVLDVPQDATDIFFGLLLNGSGTVWLNSVKFEVVGSDVPTTAERPTDEILTDEPTNLTFQD